MKRSLRKKSAFIFIAISLNLNVESIYRKSKQQINNAPFFFPFLFFSSLWLIMRISFRLISSFFPKYINLSVFTLLFLKVSLIHISILKFFFFPNSLCFYFRLETENINPFYRG